MDNNKLKITYTASRDEILEIIRGCTKPDKIRYETVTSELNIFFINDEIKTR